MPTSEFRPARVEREGAEIMARGGSGPEPEGETETFGVAPDQPGARGVLDGERVPCRRDPDISR